MIVDRSHFPWMFGTVIAAVAAFGLYYVYATNEPNGPRGGSWQGMIFGVAGSAMMIVAGLLAARKRLPRLPLGSAQTWLRAHIWLGLLSLPLILFHAGFRWGGLVEQVLLATFGLVLASGVIGLALQQYLPTTIKETTPSEAMFDQVGHVCERLRQTADERVLSECGTLFEASGSVELDKEVLREFHVTAVRPFLAANNGRTSPLDNPSRAVAIFSQVRRSLPNRYHGLLDELDALCDERRQLARQSRLHYWLHWWLFLHIPLSLSLLVLGVVHVIASVFY